MRSETETGFSLMWMMNSSRGTCQVMTLDGAE